MEVVIDKDGKVQDVKAITGHPLLVKAAVEAVSRWRYQPTLLQGQPVEVLTEVEQRFSLAD
jgi:protein TonB